LRQRSTCPSVFWWDARTQLWPCDGSNQRTIGTNNCLLLLRVEQPAARSLHYCDGSENGQSLEDNRARSFVSHILHHLCASQSWTAGRGKTSAGDKHSAIAGNSGMGALTATRLIACECVRLPPYEHVSFHTLISPSSAQGSPPCPSVGLSGVCRIGHRSAIIGYHSVSRHPSGATSAIGSERTSVVPCLAFRAAPSCDHNVGVKDSHEPCTLFTQNNVSSILDLAFLNLERYFKISRRRRAMTAVAR
jgi:hypothetical protein